MTMLVQPKSISSSQSYAALFTPRPYKSNGDHSKWKALELEKNRRNLFREENEKDFSGAKSLTNPSFNSGYQKEPSEGTSSVGKLL